MSENQPANVGSGPGVSEPRSRYVNDDTGECWAQGCGRPATHLLTVRAKPDDTFPQGLLIESGYCHRDAVWFAGATVALHGGVFMSLTERPVPPTADQEAAGE